MAFGHYEGKAAEEPCIRAMFTRESLLASDWYRDRLCAQQAHDIAFWTRYGGTNEHLRYVKSEAYLTSLVGTIGADPSFVWKTEQSTPA
jgi:hypothetical protein